MHVARSLIEDDSGKSRYVAGEQRFDFVSCSNLLHNELNQKMKLQISRGVYRHSFENITKNINRHCLQNDDVVPRTFLYFTSESYLHSLRNALILSDIPANKYVRMDVEGMELGNSDM